MELPRVRRFHAMYSLSWFDQCWTQIGETQKLVTAHTMIQELELWNRKQQLLARDGYLAITPTPCPIHVSIEVHYVEA